MKKWSKKKKITILLLFLVLLALFAAPAAIALALSTRREFTNSLNPVPKQDESSLDI